MGAVEGPDELFYKDIYLDLYQLIEIVASLPQVDDSKLASYGASQGGALALVAAGLNPPNPANSRHLSILIGFQTCIRDWEHQRGL